MKKIHTFTAVTFSLLGVLALTGVIHLVYIFPKTMATWEDDGRSLSAAEQTIADLSNLCINFGFFLIPALLLITIGCVVWAVLTGIEQEN